MTEHPVLTIHTDGAFRGNPGAAACAYVIDRPGHQPIEVAEVLGDMTNNQAEYTALVKALEHALELGSAHSVVVNSDSELMVKQMKGEYRVKNEDLRDLSRKRRPWPGNFRAGYCSATSAGPRTAAPTPCATKPSTASATAGRETEQYSGRAAQTEQYSGIAAARPEKAPPRRVTADTLRSHALACLREAAAAWGTGIIQPTPEQVWDQLLAVLDQHGVRLPGPWG